MSTINQRIIEMKASFGEQLADVEEEIKTLEHTLEDRKEYAVKLRASLECLKLLVSEENAFYENSEPAFKIEPIEEDGDVVEHTEGGMSIQLGKDSAVRTLDDIKNLAAELSGEKVKGRPENIPERWNTEVTYPGGAKGVVTIHKPADVVYVDVPEGLYGVPTRVLDAQLARKWRAEGLTEEEIAARLPDVNDLQEKECL